MRSKMTDEQIIECYRLGKEIYDRRESFGNAVAELFDKHQMNLASATMYISFFLDLMKGKGCKRSISNTAIRYYMNNIQKDYGNEQLKISLQGLEGYIDNQKNLGIVASTTRMLHNEFSKKIGITPIY